MSISKELRTRTGNLPASLTNDYFFRKLFQTDAIALRGLLSSVLKVSPDSLTEIEVENPIVQGDRISDKEFHLDLLLKLNGHRVNIELQVMNYHDWPDRSLLYLCRQFDRITRGSNYSKVEPIIHISILDFTLFDHHPEFFATYKLQNIKDSSVIYNDKFVLSVLELNHIDIATEEDKVWQLDAWASFFKLKTWEDLKMLAEKNQYLEAAANTTTTIFMDPMEQKRIVEREEFFAREAYVNNLLAAQSAELARKEDLLAEQAAELTEKDQALAKQAAELTEMAAKLAAAQAELAALRK